MKNKYLSTFTSSTFLSSVLALTSLFFALGAEAQTQDRCSFESFAPAVEAQKNIVAMVESSIFDAVYQVGDGQKHDYTVGQPTSKVEHSCVREHSAKSGDGDQPFDNTFYLIHIVTEVVSSDPVEKFQIDTEYWWYSPTRQPIPQTITFTRPYDILSPVLFSLKTQSGRFEDERGSKF